MRINWKAILLLNYVSIASSSSAFITPALPKIKVFYNLGHGSLEWVVSIFLVGYVLGQLLYTPLANRFGRLKAIKTGLYINLFGVLICAASCVFPDYSGLLFGRFMTALGSASGLVCTYILINESYEKHKAKMLIAYTVLSFSIGLGLAVFLGGVVTEFIGWQYCFAILFIYGAFMLFCVRYLDETLPDSDKQPMHIPHVWRCYIKAFRNKTLLAFSMIVGMYTVFSYCYSVAAPIIAHHYLHISPSVYGSWNLLNIVGMIAGGVIAAQLIKKIDGMRTMAIGIAIFSICIVALIIYFSYGVTAASGFFIITALAYLGSGFIYSSATFYASNVITDKAAASMVMNFIDMCCPVVGVIALGYLPVSKPVAFIGVVSVFLVLVIGARYRLRGYQAQC